MSHCMGGPGAYHFGQSGGGKSTAQNDSTHNALLALVDWVEGGREPEVIIGKEEGQDGNVRVHCRWPGWKSVWDGAAEKWVCEESDQ